jgi:hypothetical protein
MRVCLRVGKSCVWVEKVIMMERLLLMHGRHRLIVVE